MKKLLTILVTLVMCLGMLATPALANDHKVTLCHATSSETNPYNLIEVSFNSIVKGEAHSEHHDPGDIIPPFEYTENGRDGETKQYPGRNWTDEGRAIYDNGCEPVETEPEPEPEPVYEPKAGASVVCEDEAVYLTATLDNTGSNENIVFEFILNGDFTNYDIPGGESMEIAQTLEAGRVTLVINALDVTLVDVTKNLSNCEARPVKPEPTEKPEKPETPDKPTPEEPEQPKPAEPEVPKPEPTVKQPVEKVVVETPTKPEAVVETEVTAVATEELPRTGTNPVLAALMGLALLTGGVYTVRKTTA